MRRRISKIFLAFGLGCLFLAAAGFPSAARPAPDAPLPTRVPAETAAPEPIGAVLPTPTPEKALAEPSPQPVEAEPTPAVDQIQVRTDPAPPKRPVLTGAEIPVRLIIPALELEAPVVPVEAGSIQLAGQEFQQWETPDEFAAGWHDSSAALGESGNTVLNGHHNLHGEVFKDLIRLEPGDLLLMVSARGRMFRYVVANKMILPEKYATLDERLENARWLEPSQDERLTLVTCWPYESNTHRLILVASPITERERAEDRD